MFSIIFNSSASWRNIVFIKMPSTLQLKVLTMNNDFLMLMQIENFFLKAENCLSIGSQDGEQQTAGILEWATV